MKPLAVPSSIQKIGQKARPMVKNIMWMAGGVAVSVVFTVSAQQYMAATNNEPCLLTDAMQNAVNNRIRMVSMTSADPEKYFNQNCLGDLSFASLDLSIMIPDPIGLLTDAALAAVERLKQAAINKVCAAARNAIGDTIGRYNAAINSVNEMTGNVGNNVANLIDTSIAQQGQRIANQFDLNYNTPATPVNPLSGNYSNSTSGSGAGWQATQPVTLLNNNGASASDFTVAAGNLESARIALQNARQMAAAQAATEGVDATSLYDRYVAPAQRTYDQALTAYEAARQRVGNLQTSSSTVPTTRAGNDATTVGGSIFGR